MKKNMIKLAAGAAAVCLMSSVVSADDAKPKRQLKNNMMVKYNTLPGTANSISEAFANGVVYGRLRMNSFMWDWGNADESATGLGDNHAAAVGGSLIYKTASVDGLSATAGMYYADAFAHKTQADVGFTKAGKDTFSRFNAKTTDDWTMAVLGQAYLQYDMSKTTIKLGRQIFESFTTKSNDTKMIPNTFDGLTVENKSIEKTRLRLAYFAAQKLRDHTTTHDPITFKDSDGNSWNNNDDAGVHKGLTHANFTAAGKDTNHDLIVVDARNKSVENLKLDFTYASVPDVVSSMIAEANYKIKLGGKMTLTPGVRYMHQMDDGGGAIGGAGLSGSLAGLTGAQKGYKDAASLDSSLIMARLTLKDGPLKAQVGYSAVEDAGDIVAPWRGFPTGGYTRAMAQYNWRANTKTICAEVNYDFGKAKLIPGFSALARYAMQDFDDAKQAGGVQADSNILHMDLRQNVTENLYAKVRIGLIDAKERTNGTEKDSYNEYRFELNYLF